MANWEIAGKQLQCAICGAQFVEGDKLTSVLYDRGDRFERIDCCPKCFESDKREQKEFSCWQTTIPLETDEKKDNRPRFVDDETLFDFFTSLEGSDDLRRIAFRYVIALILVRKKKLKLTGVHLQDGSEYLVLSPRRKKISYKVKNPDLSEEQVAELQEQLGTILQNPTPDTEE